MKNILFLVNKHKEKYRKFTANNAQKNKIWVVAFDEILIKLSQNHNKILIANKPLSFFDQIYFRSLILQNEIAAIIIDQAKKHKIKIADQKSLRGILSEAKIFNTYLLSLKGLPIIDSMIVSQKQIKQLDLIYPLVVKKSFSCKKRDVYLCQDAEKLKKIFTKYKESLIIQPFINHKSYVRTFVIGNHVVAAMKREVTETKDDAIQSRKNALIYQTNEEQKKLSLQASQTLGYDIAGIDLIYDVENKKWTIIEVNRAPQFKLLSKTTGVNVADKISQYFMSKKATP